MCSSVWGHALYPTQKSRASCGVGECFNNSCAHSGGRCSLTNRGIMIQMFIGELYTNIRTVLIITQV